MKGRGGVESSEACGARYQNVTSIDNAPDEIAEAFYAARVHRVPVVLNLAIDDVVTPTLLRIGRGRRLGNQRGLANGG